MGLDVRERGSRQVSDHVWRDAEYSTNLLTRQLPCLYQLHVSGTHRDWLELHPCFEKGNAVSVTRPAVSGLPAFFQVLVRVIAERTVDLENASRSRPIGEDIICMVALFDGATQQMSLVRNGGNPSNTIESESLEVKHLVRLEHHRALAAFLTNRDLIGDSILSLDVHAHRIDGDWMQSNNSARFASDDVVVAVAAETQVDHLHLPELLCGLPIIRRPVDQGVHDVRPLVRPARAILGQLK